MPLTSQRRIPVAQDFVRIGFGDAIDDNAPFRSLDFVTEELTTLEAQSVIPIVKQYNEFDGERVAAAIGHFRGRVRAWKFGRAGSPLLVVSLAPWTHQIEDTDPRLPSGTRYSETEVDALVAELRQMFLVQLGADIFEQVGDDKYTHQAWWD
jgi:hypothetical protein